MKKVKDDLITLCKEEGITINQLAEVLDYHRATIRERINNPQHFTVKELVIIAELLKKTPTAIVKIILRDLKTKEVKEEAEKVKFKSIGLVSASVKEQAYFESNPDTTRLTFEEILVHSRRKESRIDK